VRRHTFEHGPKRERDDREDGGQRQRPSRTTGRPTASRPKSRDFTEQVREQEHEQERES
jgi:hypothetical protein